MHNPPIMQPYNFINLVSKSYVPINLVTIWIMQHIADTQQECDIPMASPTSAVASSSSVPDKMAAAVDATAAAAATTTAADGKPAATIIAAATEKNDKAKVAAEAKVESEKLPPSQPTLAFVETRTASTPASTTAQSSATPLPSVAEAEADEELPKYGVASTDGQLTDKVKTFIEKRSISKVYRV